MITIRLATKDDATAISSVVCNTLRRSNAQDYSETVIDRLLNNFTPQCIAEMMSRRTVFVAISNDEVIGTAALEQSTVKTVFVAPEHQRKGIGSRLMKAVEASARSAGLGSLTIASSLTAERFYTTLGYKSLKHKFFGNEETVLMERRLAHQD
ncbi:GNAT family N-acetyltransferase [Algihabitans sp.]|uniref:GNAT family N-acetyltransferase n=1 Tax=Algihabitans sp. TaxID=2821514 RepID=UPI003BABCFC5